MIDSIAIAIYFGGSLVFGALCLIAWIDEKEKDRRVYKNLAERGLLR